MERRTRNLIFTWLAAPALEWVAGAGACDPADPREIGAELALFGIAGSLQARLAPPGWRRSPAWPAVALVAAGALRGAPGGILTQLCFAVGVLGVGVLFIRVLDDLIGAGLARALIVTALGALGARYLALVQAPVAAPADALLRGLRTLGPAPGPATASSAPPIVIVSVDTLRADRAPGMETWRRLEARGATWGRAMATSSWTVPSLASLQTGLMPGEHGAGAGPDRSFQALQPEASTLAERLTEAGYQTAAFVANPFASSTLGFDRGFHLWSHPDEAPRRRWALAPSMEDRHPRDGQLVIARALRWLEDAPADGFYLWVHLMDPHLPYRHLEAGAPLDSLRNAQPLRDGTRRDDADTRADLRRAYDAEIAWTDEALQPLLDALEARGLFERGAVVFTSDHGEEFWEHGGIEHGHSHHGEVVDVPLALTAPGVAPGPRPGVASLIDVAPTLLALAGLDVGAPLGGLDLRAGVPTDRVAAAAGNLYFRQQRSARSPQARVIDTEGAGAAAWDLAADPAEQTPLDPDWIAPVERDAARAAALAAPGEVAEINVEALRALGYVE